MRDKSIKELSYIELHNGNIICLEDITDVYINSGYSFRDYYVCVGERTYNIRSEEYDKIRSLLKDNSKSYTIL